MAKPKRQLTAAERREKARRRAEFMTIFIDGKQKRVRRPSTVEGMPVDEFILRNADPLWLVQNEMWEYLDTNSETSHNEQSQSEFDGEVLDDEIPF